MDVKEKKRLLRKEFQKKRKQISEKRKKEAQKIYEFLIEKTKKYEKVLSFASKVEEIDLWPFNFFLEKEGRLFLTKVENERLVPYQVCNIEKDLLPHPKFLLLEPNPKKCKKHEEEVDLILVPGLAFDHQNNRLGFGKGYYDRFLKNAGFSYSIGIGFKEQLSKQTLPMEEHDIPLDEVCLF